MSVAPDTGTFIEVGGDRDRGTREAVTVFEKGRCGGDLPELLRKGEGSGVKGVHLLLPDPLKVPGKIETEGY